MPRSPFLASSPSGHTGPRLQLLSEDNETNRIVEQAFADWAMAVDLPAKLRTMRMAKATDGEAFAVLVNNPRLDHPVKLDLRLVEAEQITTPMTAINRPDVVDGVEPDRLGNTQAYHILREHPGAFGIGPGYVTSQRVTAESMIHWFRSDRPGQHADIESQAD